jgi:hypothetical protein
MKCMNTGCNNKARRKFCSNKCKDRYHNVRNPRGYFSHLANPNKIHDYGHPFEGGECGHGQE